MLLKESKKRFSERRGGSGSKTRGISVCSPRASGESGKRGTVLVPSSAILRRAFPRRSFGSFAMSFWRVQGKNMSFSWKKGRGRLLRGRRRFPDWKRLLPIQRESISISLGAGGGMPARCRKSLERGFPSGEGGRRRWCRGAFAEIPPSSPRFFLLWRASFSFRGIQRGRAFPGTRAEADRE